MTNFLYNPDRKSKEQLIAEFVVRTDVYDEIMHDLETSDMKTPEQHYLLVGQRGSGKTTLLNRIKYGIEDSEKLNQWLIPVIFSEEQYNISELANLWEHTGQILEDYHGFEGLSGEMEQQLESEERVYDTLEKELKKQEKKIVLLIDNIGDFLKKLDDKEVRRLREILQTKPNIRLIAGSPFYLESILDYKQPFFEFFKMIRLDGLSENETQQLLQTLGEVFNEKEKITTIITESPERIETLRVLTGGVPRTIALMFKIFIDYEHESSIQDLEKILDAVTPLYKHRMDDLATQQQKIVDAVAKNWDPISVKELKDKIRLDSKIISSQLRQLEKNQVIERRETKTKNHLYFIKERFFNIWYLMRYGRKVDRQRVIWLVKFLENWCSDADLESRILDYVHKIKSGKLDKYSIAFYGEVYTSFHKLNTKLKLLLKDFTPTYIAQEIVVSDIDLKNTFGNYIKEEKWQEALELVLKMRIVDEEVKPSIFIAGKEFFIRGTGEEKLYSQLLQSIKDAENEGSELTLGELLVFRSLLLTLILFNLFQSEFEKLDEIVNVYSETFKGAENSVFEYSLLNQIIYHLLAAKQYNIVSKLFLHTHMNLKERLKPTYYALIYLRDGNESQELLLVGREIEDSVSKVLHEIQKKENHYTKF
ncbi:MAG: AAA family ATPase [Chitinophagaceae bacterium]